MHFSHIFTDKPNIYTYVTDGIKSFDIFEMVSIEKYEIKFPARHYEKSKDSSL